VYPALTVLAALKRTPEPTADAEGAGRRRREGVEVLYVGHPEGVEASLVPRAEVPFRAIAGGQVRGQTPWRLARNVVNLWRGYRQARALVGEFRPDVCMVTGGWVSVPVALAVRRAGTVLLVYLPDTTPGLAVRALRHLATRVAVTVPEAERYFKDKAVVTGYPVREEILQADRTSARRRFGLPAEARVVLVFGGSRGARSINRAVVQGLPHLLPLAHVLHITGRLDYDWVQEARDELEVSLRERYQVHAYLHGEMADALAAADLVVSRAGASVLGEFPARGLPAVLVPYPHAGRHQEHNARYLAERGAAVMVADERLSDDLTAVVTTLLRDESRRRRMAQAAAKLARPEAAAQLAHELWGLAGA